MLPEKRKELIIWIVSIIGVILVIIIMYNFSKFMRDLSAQNNPEEIIYDDPYPSEYAYYGFMIDDDGNYQLMGFDNEFNETELGLRTFYAMDNLYYYDNHLVLYSDAINQINYNEEEEKFSFYEQNPFFSNSTDVTITPDYYVFVNNNRLEYCESPECIDRIEISNYLRSTRIFNVNNKIYYQLSDGLYEYDLSIGNGDLIVNNSRSTLEFLAINDNYLIFSVEGNYWTYNLNNNISGNITEYINLETELQFVCLGNNSLYLETIDEAGNNVIIDFSLLEMAVNDFYNIGNEKVNYSFSLSDDIVYASLIDEDNERYVIMNMEEQEIIKELDNPYVVIREVD